jgi:hypothetical protein
LKNNNLINKIIEALKEQGLEINSKDNSVYNDKKKYKEIQQHARKEQIYLHRNFLKSNIRVIKDNLLDVRNLDPRRISLELREVKSDSIDEILFRWWNLIWWSIPYQRAYGRQVRLIIWDNGNNAPFGLIGLQSPILKMSVRDNYLGLKREDLDIWVNRSMQAQRLGALPPYNLLIGGKMVAMALVSKELREIYIEKYKNSKTELLGRRIDPNLLFCTTTSAFGNSSIYNRLKYNQDKLAISLGYTKGYGSFQIPESLYKEIQEFLIKNGINVSTSFGSGPSRKIKLFDIAFRLLKMPSFSNHNLRREFFIFPLVSNLKEVIHNNEQPNYYDRSLLDMTEFWKERWCLPRARKNDDWKSYDLNTFLVKANEEIINSNINGRST